MKTLNLRLRLMYSAAIIEVNAIKLEILLILVLGVSVIGRLCPETNLFQIAFRVADETKKNTIESIEKSRQRIEKIAKEMK